MEHHESNQQNIESDHAIDQHDKPYQTSMDSLSHCMPLPNKELTSIILLDNSDSKANLPLTSSPKSTSNSDSMANCEMDQLRPEWHDGLQSNDAADMVVDHHQESSSSHSTQTDDSSDAVKEAEKRNSNKTNCENSSIGFTFNLTGQKSAQSKQHTNDSNKPITIEPSEDNNRSLKLDDSTIIASTKFNCSICLQEKQYKKPPKKYYGVLCCGSCPILFRSFLNNPQQFYCTIEGRCLLNEHRESKKDYCKSCWLRSCLQNFELEPPIRDFIMTNFRPKLKLSDDQIIDIAIESESDEQSTESEEQMDIETVTVSPTNEPKTDSNENSNEESSTSSSASASISCSSSSSNSNNESTSVSSSNISFSYYSDKSNYYYNNSYSSYNNLGHRGPRVKRVCRSIEDVYRGLPRAVFPMPQPVVAGPVPPGKKIDDRRTLRNNKSVCTTPQKSSTKRSPQKSTKKVSKSFHHNNCGEQDYDSDELPITEYINRNLEREMRESKKPAS